MLELLAKGLTNREIGQVLGISAGTAKVHVSAIIDALDVTNRTEAAGALEQLGLGRSGAMAEPDATGPEAAGSEAVPGAAYRVPGFGGRPAIAVLPFENRGAEDDAYLADGLVEDLITRLAAYRWFPVISRNSSFVYRGRATDVREASRELGARYLVEGSVRMAGDRVRVGLRLIDGASGEHLLADRYDRERTEVFQLQDELVETIVGVLDPALSRVERMRSVRKPPADLSAWDCLSRGMYHLYEGGRAPLAEARALFERALEADSHFAPAWAGVAQTRCFELTHGFADDPEHAAAEALRTARRGATEDPTDPVCQGTVGLACSLASELDEAADAYERAIHLNPSHAVSYWGLASLRLRDGLAQEAFDLLRRALRLSPHDPVQHLMLAYLGLVELVLGDLEAAVAAGRQSTRLRPDQPFGSVVAAVALALLGRLAEAREEREAAQRAAPGIGVELLATAVAPPAREQIEAGWARIA